MPPSNTHPLPFLRPGPENGRDFRRRSSLGDSGAVCRTLKNSRQLTRQLARRHRSLGIAGRCCEAAGVRTHTLYTHRRTHPVVSRATNVASPDSTLSTGAAGSILNPSCPGMSPSTKISRLLAVGEAGPGARYSVGGGVSTLGGRLHSKFVQTQTSVVRIPPTDFQRNVILILFGDKRGFSVETVLSFANQDDRLSGNRKLTGSAGTSLCSSDKLRVTNHVFFLTSPPARFHSLHLAACFNNAEDEISTVGGSSFPKKWIFPISFPIYKHIKEVATISRC